MKKKDVHRRRRIQLMTEMKMIGIRKSLSDANNEHIQKTLVFDNHITHEKKNTSVNLFNIKQPF